MLQARRVVTVLIRRAQCPDAPAPTVAKEPDDARAIDLLEPTNTCRHSPRLGEQQAAIQSLLARLMRQMTLAQSAAQQTEQADD